MKNLKMFGLAVCVSAASLMTFASAAMPSTFTSPHGETYKADIVATSTNMELDGSFVTVKCGHSKFRASVEKEGWYDAGGLIHEFTFTECNYSTTVKVNGSIDVNSAGSVDLFNTEISVTTSIGTCVFTADSGLFGGTVIGDLVEGENAYIKIASAKIPKTGGNQLCGSSATLTGTYDLTTPNNLWVD